LYPDLRLDQRHHHGGREMQRGRHLSITRGQPAY
jgi:hypothetical protein